MKYIPHEYQQYAIDYIEEHPVSAILLDMGLGKTSITLTAIHDLMREKNEIRKVLIIGPIRVVQSSWPDEIRKWDHLSDLTYSVVTGTKEERLAALQADTDLYLINRENLPWLVNESGLPFDYDMCVIDELSSFKSCSSQRFKAFMKVRSRIKRVVGLTGTPSSNGLMDLFAEYKCLDMGQRLGWAITRYRAKYFRPSRWYGTIVYAYEPLPGAEEEIYRKIGDITISMKSTDHLKMPELLSTEYTVRMDERERSQYEGMKKDLVLRLGDQCEITASNAASLSSKLMQMSGGAVYSDDGTVIPLHDRKLDALEDIIESANGNPVLVAYWFRYDLVRIRERLDKMKVKYGILNSPESIRNWNNGEYEVMLIHPASAGHGLNLQSGGNTIVWFSVPWSLELYEQTVDRLYRQGQKAGTVSVIHIVTEDTIDRRVLQALESKDSTQSALIDAVKAVLK